jgi:hypothetical protein
MEELIAAIKTILAGKALGPDEIPNELFLEADKDFLEKTRQILNRIIKEKKITDQWQIGEIIRL